MADVKRNQLAVHYVTFKLVVRSCWDFNKPFVWDFFSQFYSMVPNNFIMK